MKNYFWITFIIGIVLIVTHGFFPNTFKIDNYTILILFILSIPYLAQFLKRAKLPGAEFEFKEEIKQTQILVEESIEEASKTGKKSLLPFETFKLSAARELFNSDHLLALAALRIEIEKTLRLAGDFLNIPVKKKESLSNIIDVLQKEEILFPEQITALKKIVRMCNKAIHGEPISYKEAKRIIDLADNLNKSFSTGYSIKLFPNTDYKKDNLSCEWEHCIELMPLTIEDTKLSCPVFGHNCPGGSEKAAKCINKEKKIN
jgi:hypothetical protein